MAMTKRERDLLTTVTDMHAKMLEYLQRADARQERQFRATLKGFQALQEGQERLTQGQERLTQGQERIAQMLLQQGEILKEVQAITARALEQSNQVLLQLGGSGSTH
jgi:hypothetical protein